MAEHPLTRTRAPSGGTSTPAVPQLRIQPKIQPTPPQPSKEIVPKERGGIFMDVFKTILKLKNRDRALDQAIEDAIKGKTQ